MPSWFVVAWIALFVVWLPTSLILDRRRTAALVAARRPLAPSTVTWAPSTFALSVQERAIFGVHQTGNVVTFGPSGRQIAAAGLLPAVASTGAALALTLHIHSWAVVLVVVLSMSCTVYGLAGIRVRVWLTPDALLVRHRTSRVRTIPWVEVEAVRCELEPATVQSRGGPTTLAVVGVVQVCGLAPRQIPGFRCLSWASVNEIDDLAVTYAKVAIIHRYRQCIVGPWPEEPSN